MEHVDEFNRTHSIMHVVPTWMRCLACRCRFQGHVVANSPVDLYIESMKANRCPKCGAGFDRLGMGAGMTIPEDRTFRRAGERTLEERFEDWRELGDVGTSSMLLVRRLTGRHPDASPRGDMDPPRDSSDLRRMILVLDRLPELRPNVSQAADLSPAWAAFISRYDELEALAFEELGPDLDFVEAPRLNAMLAATVPEEA